MINKVAPLVNALKATDLQETDRGAMHIPFSR